MWGYSAKSTRAERRVECPAVIANMPKQGCKAGWNPVAGAAPISGQGNIPIGQRSQRARRGFCSGGGNYSPGSAMAPTDKARPGGLPMLRSGPILVGFCGPLGSFAHPAGELAPRRVVPSRWK